MNNSFRPAGDITEEKTNNKFFYNPGNLEDSNKSKIETPEEIKKYLSEIQTGKKSDGLTAGGAKMFVTINRLKEMVSEGYNIIKANYFDKMNLIEVEFDIPFKNKAR